MDCKPRTSLRAMGILLSLVACCLMGFFVPWLETRRTVIAEWLEQYLGFQLALGMLANVLAAIAAIGLRLSGQPTTFAWCAATLVGALVYAPVNAVYGTMLGGCGGWLARNLTSHPRNAEGAPTVTRPSLHLHRPTVWDIASLASSAVLLWLGLTDRLGEWSTYTNKAGLHLDLITSLLGTVNYLGVLLVIVSALLATSPGRLVLCIASVHGVFGFLLSILVYHFPCPIRSVVALLGLGSILCEQVVLFGRLKRSIPARPGLRKSIGPLSLGLLSWFCFWIGWQLDAVRRLTYLTQKHWIMEMTQADSVAEWLLGSCHVRELLTNRRATRGELQEIAGLPNLVTLAVAKQLPDDASLAGVSQKLVIFRTRGELTATQCQELGRLPDLQSVVMRGLSADRAAGLSSAPLRELFVVGGRLRPSALKSLQSSTLQRLGLFQVALTDNQLSDLGPLPSLTSLWLNKNQLQGSTLDRLTLQHELKLLDLSDNPIDEAALAQLQAVPTLTRLRLDGIRIRDSQKSRLSRLNLTHLSLCRTHVPDAWINEYREQLLARGVTEQTLPFMEASWRESAEIPLLRNIVPFIIDDDFEPFNLITNPHVNRDREFWAIFMAN